MPKKKKKDLIVIIFFPVIFITRAAKKHMDITIRRAKGDSFHHPSPLFTFTLSFQSPFSLFQKSFSCFMPLYMKYYLNKDLRTRYISNSLGSILHVMMLSSHNKLSFPINCRKKQIIFFISRNKKKKKKSKS